MKVLVCFLSTFVLFQSSILCAEDRAIPSVVASSNSPVWEFWKSALDARDKLNEEKFQDALDLLDHLPPPPLDLMNKQQDFYRTLYKEALETGMAASDRLSKPSETWSRNIWALFPDLEEPLLSYVPADVRVEDKVTRVYILFEKSLLESIPEILSSAEIANSSLPAQDKCRAFFELGSALRRLNKKEEALEVLAQVERSECEGKILTRAFYWKGTVEAGLGRDDAAEETLKQLTKRSADERYMDDAYYRLYKIYQSHNDDEKAARALRQLLELPEGDMKEKYLWDEAFSAYQDKNYEKALDLLDKIIATRSIGTEAQPQALYWKGRTEEILSKKKLGGSSVGGYHKVVSSYPFSFYAILAEVRLGKLTSIPSIAKSKSSLPSKKGPIGDAIRVVDELNRKGDHEAAADVLDYLTYLHPEVTKENPGLIAQRWMESNDFNRAIEIATERFDVAISDINLRKDDPLTRALYPVAYKEEVARAAETNRLPLGLIEGIMREESLFQREVRSYAGAIGLMQLMPATARMKARSLGIYHSIGDLKTPASNILLGSSYLREMMDRFGNRAPLAVMAYNAGPGNVSKWIRSQGYMPFDEFIESIPLSETRGYVKRVLRSAHIYEGLLGQSKPTKYFQSLDPPQ